jgi:hypothetical protein
LDHSDELGANYHQAVECFVKWEVVKVAPHLEGGWSFAHQESNVLGDVLSDVYNASMITTAKAFTSSVECNALPLVHDHQRAAISFKEHFEHCQRGNFVSSQEQEAPVAGASVPPSHIR